MEIWKDIVGYEGIAQVSNLGRVKSINREFHNYTKKEKAKHYIELLIELEYGMD